MADGQSRSYSANAQKAAASGSDCSPGGCDACVKTGLPVLLVRPGLVDKTTAGKAAKAIAPLLPGVADPALTHAGYAMRTLRNGYLYAYYEKAHTAQIKQQNGWQVFRVDDGGYLTPMPLAELGCGDPPEFACTRVSSYATAMLFVIPDAKNTERVWAGFTSSPWSQQTLDQYAGDEALRNKRMACINAPDGGSDRSIALTVDNVETGVVDYMPALSDDALKGNPFPRRLPARPREDDAVGAAAIQPQPVPSKSKLFPAPPMKGRPEGAGKLLEQAKKLIAQDPGKTYTDANLMMVSVPDAEGVTFEAAVRRVTLCNTAAEWVAHFPNGDWMMKSALQAEGMLSLIEQQGEGKKTQYADANYRQYDRTRMYRTQFDELKRDGQLPPDADFIPQMSHDGMARMPDYSKPGYVSVPSASDIDRATGNLQEEVRGQLTRTVDGLDYRGFRNRHKQKAKADADRLKQVEQDYFAWLQSDAVKQLTCHDFSTESQIDGWHYAQCVRAITYGGPLTDKGLDVFKPLVGGDATDTNALVARALLGNRPEFFAWFSQLEQGGKAFDTARGLFDLEPINQALTGAWRTGAQAAAADLQNVVSATLAGLDKLDQLGEKLRYQYELLAMILMSKSEAAPIQLFRLQVTLPEATRIWNNMLSDATDIVQRAGETAGRRVQSLVMGVASAVEMTAGSSAAMGVIDVYLLAGGNDASWKQTLKPVKSASHRYLIAPVNAGAASALQYIDDIGLRAMTRDSMQVLRTGSGALAAGAGALQVLLLGKAWKQYRNGSDTERQAAAVAMLTSGLGVASSMLELSSMVIARQAGKELAEAGLKQVAGFIAAGATAIDAVMAFINAEIASSKGDDAATAGYRLQGLLFGFAAGAIFGATMAVAGTGSFAGMSALALTGWGLLLVGLGVLVGFVILVLKDKPVEAWAAKTFWGDADASEKWGSYKREVQAANMVVVGATADFAYRWNTAQKASAALLVSSPVVALANIGADAVGLPNLIDAAQLGTREAWLRLQMAKELRTQLPWRVTIYGVGADGATKIAAVGGDGSGNVGLPGSLPVGASDFDFNAAEDGNSVTVTVRLELQRYRSAYAKLEIYLSAAAGDLFTNAVGNGDSTVMLVNQEIRE